MDVRTSFRIVIPSSFTVSKMDLVHGRTIKVIIVSSCEHSIWLPLITHVKLLGKRVRFKASNTFFGCCWTIAA